MPHYITELRLEECVQYCIGRAWKKHTAEAMRTAHSELQGIRRLILWIDKPDAILALRFENEQRRLLDAANLIEEGKL
jgi:hypothetical protein